MTPLHTADEKQQQPGPVHARLHSAAAALSDADLLGRVAVLARAEREATVELLAHLAELDARRLYLGQGYASLCTYCTGALRLAEHAAYNRIEVARASLELPAILDLLVDGSLNLATARLLAPHLRPDNFEAVVAVARGKSKREVEVLVARLAPRPDVPSSVRRLPAPSSPGASSAAAVSSGEDLSTTLPGGGACAVAPPPGSHVAGTSGIGAAKRVGMAAETIGMAATTLGTVAETNAVAAKMPGTATSFDKTSAVRPADRPVCAPLAPARYRVQFTMGEETHEKLRRVQDLLRREVPDGDPAAIFDRALTLLVEDIGRKKLAETSKPRPSAPTATVSPGVPAIPSRGVPAIASLHAPGGGSRRAPGIASAGVPLASRHVPASVKRAVWMRDAGRCAFVAANGQRCTERAFLELHHQEPFALGGEPTVGNIALRCSRHHAYETELAFGPRLARRKDSPRDESESSRGACESTPPPTGRARADGCTDIAPTVS